MSFPKLTLSLSITGLLAGLAASLLVTPRFTATATMIVRDNGDDANTRNMYRKILEGLNDNIAKMRSGERLAAMIEDPRPFELYKEERKRMPIEKVVAIAREAIQVSLENSGSQSFSIVRIRTTYRDQRGAMDLINAVIMYLIRSNSARMRDLAAEMRDLAAEKDRRFRTRIQELKARLAALEARAGVAHHQQEKVAFVEPPAYWTEPLGTFEPLDLPVTPRNGYPNRWAFMLTGAAIAFLFVPLIHANSRRRGRAAHGRPAQTRPY